jgi:hypothetical protein
MTLGFSISASELWTLIGSSRAPRIIDTRRREIYESAPGMLPAASWRDPQMAVQWMPALDRSRPMACSPICALQVKSVTIGL